MWSRHPFQVQRTFPSTNAPFHSNLEGWNIGAWCSTHEAESMKRSVAQPALCYSTARRCSEDRAPTDTRTM